METWVNKLLPVWNVPPEASLPPGSRDQLGFQRYANRFADRLLPDITVLTNRARYYAFIAWALSEIRRHAITRLDVGDALTYEEYSHLLARLERYLALAEAVSHGTDRNGCTWVGQRRSGALARGSRRRLPLDISLTAQEGSRGVLADYRLSMQRLGLLQEEPRDLPDTLTPDGEELADLYRATIKKARADRVRDLCLDDAENDVHVDELAKNGPWMCLSAISAGEQTFLRPRLLEGAHAPVVAELKSRLRGARLPAEADLLDHYLLSEARQGAAFDLKQVALHQVFALGCLAFFDGVRAAFTELGQVKRLDEIIADQLKEEGLKPSASLKSVANAVDWRAERQALLSSDAAPGWVSPSLRLLSWVSQRVAAERALVFPEPVESVSLPDMAALLSQTGRSVADCSLALAELLLRSHERVFASKRKRPWLRSTGLTVELSDDIGQPPLSFPPNSIRLNSLVTLYRDLKEAR